MSEQWRAALALLPEYLGQHVLLSAAALVIATLISLPTALLVASRPTGRTIVLGLARLVQTIPGLALIALFYPILLALSGVTQQRFGFSLPTLGFLPALLALTVFAILPILQNAVLGLTSIAPDVIEASDAVGMTRRQRLTLVDIPLAAPIAMAGLRTSAVWTIGAATLATPVGQTSLGNYIFSGLQTENWVFVLFGCLAAAMLAIVADSLLALVEHGVARRRTRPVIAGVAMLAIGVAAAGATGLHRTSTYVIAAKNFSEQFILAELIGQQMRAAGLSSSTKSGLGSAVIFRALAAGDVDVYVDYSGTLWTNVMERSDMPPHTEMLAAITQWMQRERGVKVLGSLGFQNAYGFVMRRQRAQELGISTIADLARHAGQLSFGADLEFTVRPEWQSARSAYNLNFRSIRTYDPTLMYRALMGGEADVISGFTSDGRIAASDLVVLSDPQGAIPPYDALLLVTGARAGDTRLLDALKPLVGVIDIETMRSANYTVDRDSDKLTPAAAAQIIAKRLTRKDDPPTP